MTNRIWTMMMAVVMMACSSSSDSDGDSPAGVPNEVNACATPGALYDQHCAERDHGTCGPMSDRIVSIDDPAVTAARCSSVTQASCKATGVDCRTTVDAGGVACDVTETYTTTFEVDGSAAASVATMSIECADGSSCVSTYDCTMARQ